MADLIGIEISNEIYGLQDETARAAADSAESKAENAASSVETLAENLETDITAVLKKYLPSETVLWTNPNPAATIQQLEITVPKGYDEYLLKWKLYAHQGDIGQIMHIFASGADDQWLNIMGTSDFWPPNNGYVFSRDFSINTRAENMVFYFQECISYDFSGDSTPPEAEQPSRCIPLEIIGIKKGAALPA